MTGHHWFSQPRHVFPRQSLVALAAVAVAILLVPGCGGGDNEPDLSLERIQQAGVVLVGVDPSYPPFASYGPAGDLVGFEIDLAAAIAESLGVSARFVTVESGALSDALIARRADLAIGGLVTMPELQKQLAFSQPYFDAGQIIVVRAGARLPTSSSELAGSVVAFESGSAADVELRALSANPKPILRPMYTAEDALRELKDGRADAAIVDVISARLFLRGTSGLAMSSVIVRSEPFVVVNRARDKSLLGEVDKAIGNLDESGYLQQLRDRWL